MLNIVLFQPEIPENTGNIARNCVGFNATLHLIRPYGFILNEKKVRRAGLDYWDNLKLVQYDDWKDFEEKTKIDKDNIFLITKFASKELSEINESKLNIDKDIYFVFGRETKGLPEEITNKYFDQRIKINMNNNVRSFNLSNCVSIVSYNYHRITNFKKI